MEWGLQHLGRALEMEAPISDAFAPFDVLTLLTLFLAMATMALGTLLTAGARARASIKKNMFFEIKVLSSPGMEGLDHVFDVFGRAQVSRRSPSCLPKPS